jgi:hypothetical protein
LNISTSVLLFEVSGLISLDRISTLVLSFPGICHNRKLYSCNIRYHLACRAFSFCGSWKYFRFSLVALAQAFPRLLADAIVNLHKRVSASSPSGGRDPRHPRMTITGPTRRQVLFTVDDATVRVDFERCTRTLNNFLSSQKANLRVELTTCTYGGWALSTNTSPTPTQVDLIWTGLTEHYWSKPSFKVEAYVPASKSYLKLVDIPHFSVGRVPTTGNDTPKNYISHFSRNLRLYHSHL